MKAYKLFTYQILGFVLFFALANLIVWFGFTRRFFDDVAPVGDIGRLGYVDASAINRKLFVDLPRKHSHNFEEFAGKNNLDVLTLGDSFSSGRAGGGRNPFYQDYIATNYNLNVLQLNNLPSAYHAFDTVIMLYNSGFLDEVKPKYIILESVERQIKNRYARSFDFSKTEPLTNVEDFYRKDYQKQIAGNPNNYFRTIPFMNSANFNFFLYKILYNFSDRAYFSRTRIQTISKPLFSRNPYKLLTVNVDVEKAEKTVPEDVKTINDNLNRLQELLAKKHIKLVFLPAPDKYNIYREYIVHNRYKAGIFFEELRKLPKQYYFVDTKRILKAEVDKGVLDIYHPDDCHWSWRGEEKIVENLSFLKPHAELASRQ